MHDSWSARFFGCADYLLCSLVLIIKNAHAWCPVGHASVSGPVANVAKGCQPNRQDLLAGVWLGEEPS